MSESKFYVAFTHIINLSWSLYINSTKSRKTWIIFHISDYVRHCTSVCHGKKKEMRDHYISVVFERLNNGYLCIWIINILHNKSLISTCLVVRVIHCIKNVGDNIRFKDILLLPNMRFMNSISSALRASSNI